MQNRIARFINQPAPKPAKSMADTYGEMINCMSDLMGEDAEDKVERARSLERLIDDYCKDVQCVTEPWHGIMKRFLVFPDGSRC